MENLDNPIFCEQEALKTIPKIMARSMDERITELIAFFSISFENDSNLKLYRINIGVCLLLCFIILVIHTKRKKLIWSFIKNLFLYFPMIPTFHVSRDVFVGTISLLLCDDELIDVIYVSAISNSLLPVILLVYVIFENDVFLYIASSCIISTLILGVIYFVICIAKGRFISLASALIVMILSYLFSYISFRYTKWFILMKSKNTM